MPISNWYLESPARENMRRKYVHLVIICSSMETLHDPSNHFEWPHLTTYPSTQPHLHTSPYLPSTNQSNPPSKLSLTHLLHRLLNSAKSSLQSFAASTLAGLSSLGEPNILITLSKIVSGVCTGLHLSDADSYPYLSSSGGCRIDMHTVPSG